MYILLYINVLLSLHEEKAKIIRHFNDKIEKFEKQLAEARKKLDLCESYLKEYEKANDKSIFCKENVCKERIHVLGYRGTIHYMLFEIGANKMARDFALEKYDREQKAKIK